MSSRRMFSPDIICSEEFLDTPRDCRDLYYQLAIRADDDGFVQPKPIMRMIGATDDELKILLAKRFLLRFESGVVVIKHWLIHNMIRQDRYKPTRFQNERKTLQIREDKVYTEHLATNGLQNGNQMATQVSIGKGSLGKKKTATKVDSPSKPKRDKKDLEKPLDLPGFVAWCAKSNQRHINIIGEWADTTKPNFQTVGQWESYMKRFLRPARLLAPFTQEQLEEGYRKMKAESDWLKRATLETLFKFVTT